MRARVLNRLKIARAARTIEQNPRTVVFVTPLLRAREIKMASALRSIGWIVILLYKQTTPITPDDNFDITIQASTDEDLHSAAKRLRPRICHVFSGAVDELLLRFCRDKPGRVVIDLNDVFCPSMFNYLQERFEPTRECLSKADGVCARDLQPKFAERYDGFRLPRHTLLFPEYTWRNGTADSDPTKKSKDDEVRIVSVGTITLEKNGWYESGLLKLAQMFADQKIHLHIYPHWFYRPASGSVFNFNLNTDFADFIELQRKTPYLHLHKSLSLEELALELPQYDFGIVSGGCPDFGQRLDFLTDKYMKACYSGRISDYLDARLPILINREVAFNDWLLKRYGIGVDLAGILKPGFREKLLDIKRSKWWRNRIERAAEMLALSAHANRLEEFYKRVVGERDFEDFKPPRLVRWAQKMPMVSASFARYERTLAQVSSLQTARILKSRITAYEAERRTFETRMDQIRAEMRAEIKSDAGVRLHLQWQVQSRVQRNPRRICLGVVCRTELLPLHRPGIDWNARADPGQHGLRQDVVISSRSPARFGRHKHHDEPAYRLGVVLYGIFCHARLPALDGHFPLALVICVGLMSLGLAWFLSSLAVFVRDVPSVTSPLNMVLMFVSGVFFPISSIPPRVAWLFKLNPIAIIIDQARAVFLYGKLPSFTAMAIVFILSLLTAIGGYWFFSRTKLAFADVL